MNIRELLQMLLVWGLYPVWLLAGAGDYLCHRQTDIEHTSGTRESWLHLLQFVTLLIAFAAAALMNLNAIVFGIMLALVIAHSVLAHMDVSYTDGRRYISPIEQLVHGFMDVVPLIAVVLIGVLHWSEITTSPTSPIFSLRPPELGRTLLLSSFAVMSGAPILEELARTYRHRGDRHVQAGFVTIK
jgi:ABC-type amino acid transport system permease subunit